MISQKELINQENRKGPLSISIDLELIDALESIANKTHWSIDFLLEKILKNELSFLKSNFNEAIIELLGGD